MTTGYTICVNWRRGRGLVIERIFSYSGSTLREGENVPLIALNDIAKRSILSGMTRSVENERGRPPFSRVCLMNSREKVRFRRCPEIAWGFKTVPRNYKRRFEISAPCARAVEVAVTKSQTNSGKILTSGGSSVPMGKLRTVTTYKHGLARRRHDAAEKGAAGVFRPGVPSSGGGSQNASERRV